jgi:hypothetical protein
MRDARDRRSPPHQLARATTVSPLSFDQSLVLRAQVHLSIVLIPHTRLCTLSIACLQEAAVMAVACLRAAEQWRVAGRGQLRACHIAVLGMKRLRRLTILGEVCRAEECTDKVVDCPPP